MARISDCAFKNLKGIFERNYRLTHLYALLLERCPEIITEELVNSLCKDTGLDRKAAVSALLCEVLGLDTEGSPEDRILYRDYLIPSVRILNADKYKKNPYYENVKLPDVKRGSWEFRTEKYAPFRAVICDDMVTLDDFTEYAPLGFFEEEFEFPAVLEDGNEWMTLTPVDLDTCEEAISDATGKVITFGLGLGYYAYMVSRKQSVNSITVVEKSEKVIELFKEYVLPHFDHPEKVRIINADAFEYAEHQMPEERYDYAFVDTWRDASDGEVMYRRMKPLETLNPHTKFSYWIEGFILSRLRSFKYGELDDAFNNGLLDLSKEDVYRALKNPLSYPFEETKNRR